jgi:hypothetical protein
MKYAEKELISLVRDPTSVGVIVSATPGTVTKGVQTTSDGRTRPGRTISDNHYQVYWSAGTHTGFDIEECWHTEEELTLARK